MKKGGNRNPAWPCVIKLSTAVVNMPRWCEATLRTLFSTMALVDATTATTKYSGPTCSNGQSLHAFCYSPQNASLKCVQLMSRGPKSNCPCLAHILAGGNLQLHMLHIFATDIHVMHTQVTVSLVSSFYCALHDRNTLYHSIHLFGNPE